MKKQLTLALTFFGIVLAFSSCIFLGPSISGNGHVTKETRDIHNFDEIKVSTGMPVTLVQSDKELITIEADENLHDVIRTELKHRELNIFTDERIRKYRRLRIIVEFKDLKEIRTSSGARVKTDGIIHVKELSTSASSGSNQTLSIDSRQFDGKTSSGADMNVDGKAEDVELRASSGSNLRAGGLTVESCNADVSSGANIHIEVTKKIDGEASSGGNIYYSGNPNSVNIKTSSGGHIQKQ